MHFLGKLTLILSLCALSAVGRGSGRDAQNTANMPGFAQMGNPRNTDKENEVLAETLSKVQTELESLIVALGYSEDLKEAGNIEEFLNRNPDFALEALVALGRDYNASNAALRTAAIKTGALATAMAVVVPASISVLYELLFPLTLPVAARLSGSRDGNRAQRNMTRFMHIANGLIKALSALAGSGAVSAAYHYVSSSSFNELIYGKSIKLKSKIPTNSLGETTSFVACYLGSPEGPWVWLKDDQGNSIPGAWGEMGSTSWSFATQESPLSLKTRCGAALLKEHPEKDKISPKDVLVFASTRVNIYPIEYYVGMGESAYKLSDILAKEE